MIKFYNQCILNIKLHIPLFHCQIMSSRIQHLEVISMSGYRFMGCLNYGVAFSPFLNSTFFLVTFHFCFSIFSLTFSPFFFSFLSFSITPDHYAFSDLKILFCKFAKTQLKLANYNLNYFLITNGEKLNGTFALVTALRCSNKYQIQIQR